MDSSRSAETAAREHDRAHVLARIGAAVVGQEPFYHTFIERIFPPDLYDAVRAHVASCKSSDDVQERRQDNPDFVNERYSLFHSTEGVVERVRAIFSDPEVKRRLLAKFYVSPSQALAESLSVHEEFEYVFTRAGRFQNIHVDIPPKYMSFVFYVPLVGVSPAEEERNATILYDKVLEPHYRARFKANSVCVFVPHFHSYHGFSSTVDRDVLVMFYVNRDQLRAWQTRPRRCEAPPFDDLLDAVEAKLRTHRLIEFAGGERRLAAERAACLVNAPQGRVRA
jgi:hypothetical protein